MQICAAVLTIMDYITSTIAVSKRLPTITAFSAKKEIIFRQVRAATFRTIKIRPKRGIRRTFRTAQFWNKKNTVIIPDKMHSI